jgi:hypothetical protein
MKLKIFLFFIPFSILTTYSNAQSVENTGWLFLSHTQKLTEKFDVLADAQLRTSDQYTYWKNVLLRTALSYNLSKKHSIAVGYAYLGEGEKTDDGKETSVEHRSYAQYQFNFKARKKEISFRGRFEQRFIKEDEKVMFSQRARIFASLQAPIFSNKDFSNGLYVKIQNELFLNVQYKDRVNNSILDQNRPYSAVGFRVNEKMDFELGYMRLLKRELDEDMNLNVMQVMITTSF